MPNCKNKNCPEILPGTYPYKSGIFPKPLPALRLGNDGTVPTRNPNPNQNGNKFATGVWFHIGWKPDQTGSEGCLTLDPKYWNEFIRKTGRSGNITVW